MANRFTEPETGLEPRPDLEQREGEDDEIFALVEMAIAEIRTATDSLASGDLSVDAWYDQMADILYAYHLAGWYVGSGADDDPTDEQMDDLAEFMAQELEYLDNFRNDLLKEKDDILAPSYRNRAELYGWATGVSFWRGYAGGYGIRLPFYPGEKSRCQRRCLCRWAITIVDIEQGKYEATWLLGSTEDHCDECVARANGLKPLRIDKGEYDQKQVTAKMVM